MRANISLRFLFGSVLGSLKPAEFPSRFGRENAPRAEPPAWEGMPRTSSPKSAPPGVEHNGHYRTLGRGLRPGFAEK